MTLDAIAPKSNENTKIARVCSNGRIDLVSDLEKSGIVIEGGNVVGT